METIKLTIPNMKSTHCQITVKNAVEATGGKIISVEPTRIDVDVPAGLGHKEIISAIENAGYIVK